MPNKKRITKKIESTAYHEAGHAVMAFLMKRRFSYVSIEPKEESLGRVVYGKWPKSIDPEIDSGPKVERYLENSIMIGLAGHVAERLFRGRNNWMGSSEDVHDAANYAFYLGGDGELVAAYLKYLFIRVRQMLEVRRNWAAVEALAQKLLEQNQIGYKKARQIIRDSRRQKY